MNMLISDVDRLRICCPWYQMLTFESLRTYLAEEFQEVIEALNEGNPNSLEEELGDLLFQILLYSQLADERGWFTMQEILERLHQKIIRRNPHVFGDMTLTDLEAVNLHWQSVKQQERNQRVERKTGNV